MTDFKFPDVGEGITEGEIVKWRVKEGDTVKEDTTLLEVETAKAIVEIPAPMSGKIIEIRGKPGDTINVGDVLVVFGDKGRMSTPKTQEKRKSVGVVGELKEATETSLDNLKALPAIRMLAKKLNVDLGSITPTGPKDRITIQDVKQAAHIATAQTEVSKKTQVDSKPLKSQPITKSTEKETIVPLKGVRKAIADNMVKAIFGIPHVTHMDEADITHLVDIKTREKEVAKKKGVHLTYLPFIIKAVIAGLKEHPMLNASIDEKAENIIIKNYYNIGIAVDTPNGLIVPNIKDADKKKLLKIAKEIFNLADKTRTRHIDLASLQGATFTITNYGAVGGIFATPIINPPEVANLGIGRILQKPMIINDEIVVRHVLPISLSFDHRVIDGAEAARFANTMIKYLEDPDLFIVES